MPNFTETMLRQETRPDQILTVDLPRREHYTTSPVDWRDEVLYFLLPDRFSNGQEKPDKLLDWKHPQNARPAGWRWDKWTESGSKRWQGGTIKGIISKLDYLKKLGVTAIWVGPMFKQRSELDTYHGYGIQDFLEVDPRFGSRQDLVDLVDEAHHRDMRIILDIIFNHSGSNFIYSNGDQDSNCPRDGVYEAQYKFGNYDGITWLDGQGNRTTDNNNSKDAAVWPEELRNKEFYTRAGTACDMGAGDIEKADAVHKRTDFLDPDHNDLRDFNLLNHDALNNLAKCYQYWIALTDCDGFRIDTVKHVPLYEAQVFCNAIKEYAASLGKEDFFIVGEVAGGDATADRYIHVMEQNMNAALDIGQMRLTLRDVAKGLANPADFFDMYEDGKRSVLGSHRKLGKMHVSILDDHDHVFGEKTRFSRPGYEHQVAAGVALQLFTLGIPCIYYGTEQAFSGPEESERQYLTEWGSKDWYLREAMFGPEHPRKSGNEGVQGKTDSDLPGFGPFGTSGYHCFNEEHPVYRRIAAMNDVRHRFPALRCGRQYQRPVSLNKESFTVPTGQLTAWSRILADEENLCVLNTNGNESKSGDVLVDAKLSPPGSKMTVILNTAQAAEPNGYSGSHPVGSTLEVKQKDTGEDKGKAYVEIRDLKPSETLVLTNHP